MQRQIPALHQDEDDHDQHDDRGLERGEDRAGIVAQEFDQIELQFADLDRQGLSRRAEFGQPRGRLASWPPAAWAACWSQGRSWS